jgi:ketosteroid isomerase-like protein
MSDALQLAKHYFDLSNEGKLADIKKLFTPSSTYSSANTGVYLGVEQIMAMQAEFFAGYEFLSWNVHNVEEVRPGVVLFDFTFSGKIRDGKTVSRRGVEYVVVHDGKIQHIEVRNKE